LIELFEQPYRRDFITSCITIFEYTAGTAVRAYEIAQQ